MASLSSSGGAGFLSGGFAQRKFELQSKNTANTIYYRHDQKSARNADWFKGKNKTMKKIILSGLLTGLVLFLASQVVSKIFGIIFPAINAEYQNPNLFRSFKDPLMLLFFLHPFLVGVLLAWFWNKTKSLFGENAKGGAKFGLSYWVVSTIPGMFATYSSMPYSLAIVLSWTIGGLISAVLAGIILMKLNRTKEGPEN